MVPGAPGQTGKQIQMKKNKRKQKQYKMTKKDWMELLDFWPMTIVVPIMLVLILFGPWIMR